MVLRDGRTLIGYLRSVDQFGTSASYMIVLSDSRGKLSL